ncbi:hypothetical protein C8R46DRAFT_1220392 [Mycena filopes]|nr:hypothetical protein C8R46DRAFT_1220392 [Mycena filopes]
MSSEEEVRSTLWDDHNLKAAREELARKRAIHENSEEFMKRHAAWQRSERILRKGREQDDFGFANDLAAEWAQMDADQELAQKLLDEDRARLDRQRRKFEKTKEKLERRFGDKVSKNPSTTNPKQEPRSSPAIPTTTTPASRPRPTPKATSAPKSASAHRDAPAPTTEAMPRQTHTFRDRVVLQRYRREEITMKGFSGIEDQGIEWDDEGQLYDAGPAPSRGSSVGTRGGRRSAPKTNTDGRTPAEGASKRTTPQDAPDPKQGAAAAGPAKQSTGSKKETPGQSPQPKKEEAADAAGTGGGGKPPRRLPAHVDPYDSDSSSSSSSDSQSSDDDTVEPRYQYSSSSEASDSAWDQDPLDVISKAKRKALATDRKSVKTAKSEESHRQGMAFASGAGGNEPTDSSSSSVSASSDGDQKPGKGPSKTPRKRPHESEKQRKRRHHRNKRRKHHKRADRDGGFHMYEAGDPALAGIPAKQLRKWQKSLHAPFIQHYEAMLGKPSKGASILDEHRNVRIPPPEKYSGSKDIKVFESHVASMCQWFQIIGLAGPDFDEKRKGLHSFHLTGEAKEWYDTRVNGIQRPKKKWTHLQMILGLFDHFIDTSCVQRATQEFWNAKYSPEIGIAGFYHELVVKANRMVKRPDSYTFRNQLMGKMPAPMVKHLVSRNVTVEYCTIGQILSAA